ncbi:hypothetical protein Vau01_016140 [Virgisporangium aurantiacum]|uniref:Uncharacterized protein n=1 Tax=Virgisporangium aurantiacum TaxID=175570 RepID=A0A8J3Z2Y5_9ACTN|nr:hypothetical protein Vau01_016140 [Virgisporangium aurantiacum]
MGGEVVGDGPGEQVAAGENAATEENPDVDPSTRRLLDHKAAQRADVTPRAEVDEGVELRGDGNFHAEEHGGRDCGLTTVKPHLPVTRIATRLPEWRRAS